MGGGWGTSVSTLLYIGICSPEEIGFSCCGVKLCIDFKLCGLKQGKVFLPFGTRACNWRENRECSLQVCYTTSVLVAQGSKGGARTTQW